MWPPKVERINGLSLKSIDLLHVMRHDTNIKKNFDFQRRLAGVIKPYSMFIYFKNKTIKIKVFFN